MQLTNTRKTPLTLHVEPWGDQLQLAPGDTVKVTAEGPEGGSLEISCGEDSVTVFGWSGSTVKVEPVES